MVRGGLEPGRDPAHSPLRHLLGARDGPAAAHRVVEGQARGDVGALPDRVLEGVEEGDRLDQVRRDPGEHELALLERLADEPEVELLEVAHPSVEELARARRGPRGEVPLLDERHLQAARRGVEGDPGAGDATPDDEDVEVLARDAAPGLGALLGVQRCGSRHGTKVVASAAVAEPKPDRMRP